MIKYTNLEIKFFDILPKDKEASGKFLNLSMLRSF